MYRLFENRPKKSPKSSQYHPLLEIPTNIAAGPLGFRVELGAGPEGEAESFLQGPASGLIGFDCGVRR